MVSGKVLNNKPGQVNVDNTLTYLNQLDGDTNNEGNLYYTESFLMYSEISFGYFSYIFHTK